ncbi:MAG: 4Fe-4S binding protein [Spirochaetota bacterium]|nr:4Fe-4S binding protein [Spirochaetota bacterium]
MLFKVTTRLRAAIMTLVFIVFAIILDYSGLKCALKMPSPLCSLTRPFLFIKSGNLDIPLKFIIALSTIGILSLIGNKLFCGWVCPIGAIQEMMNLIPFSGKRIKIPFLWMNLVRVTLFVSFIPILFVLGRVIYFNPFAPIRLGFTADFWTIYSWVFLIIIVIISFFIYRPYCYFICPIGLITWLLERISPIKIRYHKEICSECKTCITHTNCPTVESIINEKRIRPDCHSCGKCIEVCPNNALKFNFK